MSPALIRWGARRPALTCRELVELVTDYLEDALSGRDRTRFERHITACPHCHAYLQQLRVTLLAVGSLSETDVRVHGHSELLDAFRHWHQGSAPEADRP